jgi:hypothetical protein
MNGLNEIVKLNVEAQKKFDAAFDKSTRKPEAKPKSSD